MFVWERKCRRQKIFLAGKARLLPELGLILAADRYRLTVEYGVCNPAADIFPRQVRRVRYSVWKHIPVQGAPGAIFGIAPQIKTPAFERGFC